MSKQFIGPRPDFVRLAVAIAIGTTLWAGVAAAAEDELDEVQVTGSRIKRANDFDTANPTTVVDADYMKNLGIVNVGDAVKALPANISNNTPSTTGNANFFTGSTIANLRGLNPFFGTRTLTLVDTRRVVPNSEGSAVDLTLIPSVLVERVDDWWRHVAAAAATFGINVDEPEDRPWGMRDFPLADPSGVLWRIAQPIAD